MQFYNIRRNILDLMGEYFVGTGEHGPVGVRNIYQAFSDIPKENITEALNALGQNGFVEISAQADRVYITRKGLSRIEIKNATAGNNKMAIARGLDR